MGGMDGIGILALMRHACVSRENLSTFVSKFVFAVGFAPFHL